MRSFQAATLIYDATVSFCARFLDQRSRTVDQMVQAARSGRQNIAEGSRASATSTQTELRRVNVARASLDELLLDYEDFLRQRGLGQWEKDDPEAIAVREVGKRHRTEESPEWVKNLPRYDNPNLGLAIEQLVGTFVPYFLLLSLIFVTNRLGVSSWATFLLALIAVPFYIRIFIFFHDCGHGSFFRNKKANTILAYVCGILTFTPFEQWRHDHALHHVRSGLFLYIYHTIPVSPSR